MPSRCNFYIGVSPHQQIIGVEVVGLLKLHGGLEVLFNPDGWHAQDTEQQERATTRIGGFSGGNGFVEIHDHPATLCIDTCILAFTL